MPLGSLGSRKSALSLRSPGQAESLTWEILVGDFHGIGHAGLFLGLHQAAAQRDDTLRKNQDNGPTPHPAQVTEGLIEPSANIQVLLKAWGYRSRPELSQRDTAWEGARSGLCNPHRLAVGPGQETSEPSSEDHRPLLLPLGLPHCALGRGPSPWDGY